MPDNANYETLFNRADICECSHCRSIYSAAAYLVDIMQYLHKSVKNEDISVVAHDGTLQGKSPWDVLLSRRPDLQHLPLTCENTNTVIPYIDLVNEVMEFYVANNGLSEFTGYDTGETTTDELRANPQNVIKEAYGKLKDALYPFSLPYHQPLDVIRKYLEHLQTSRYELMKSYRNDNNLMENDPVKIYNYKALAAEYFNLSEEEYRTITLHSFEGTTSTITIREYFGYSASDTNYEQIVMVPQLLKRTGLQYTELIEIIKTRFVNPDVPLLNYIEELFSGSGLNPNELYAKLAQINDRTLNVIDDPALMSVLNSLHRDADEFQNWVINNFDQFTSVITLFEPSSGCDLTKTSIRTVGSVYETPVDEEDATVNLSDSGISEGTLSRLHRFIRLWKKTGWSIRELDNLLYVLGNKDDSLDEVDTSAEGVDIRASQIVRFTQAQQISNLLKLSLTQVACFWGEIETYGDGSLYSKLFLSKSLQKIDQVFVANNLGKYLTGPDFIQGHLPAVLAAFKLSASDINYILTDAGLPLTNTLLTISNMSIIYCYSLLAKAMQLTIPLLCQVKGILSSVDTTVGEDIFTDPYNTLKFIETVNNLKNSGFTIPQLNYIVTTNQDIYNESFFLNEEKVFQTFKSIRDGFLQINQEHPESDIETINEDLLRQKLSLLFAPDVTEKFLGILNGQIVFSVFTAKDLTVTIPEALNKIVSYDSVTGYLQCFGFLTEDEKNTLRNIPVSPVEKVPEYQVVIDNLFNNPSKAISNKIVFSTTISPPINIEIPGHLNKIITYTASNGLLKCIGVLSENDKSKLTMLPETVVENIYSAPEKFIRDNFSILFDTDIENVITYLLDHPAQNDKLTLQDKWQRVYRVYLPYLKKKFQRDAVVQNISNLIGLDTGITSVITRDEIDNLIADLLLRGLTGQYFLDGTFTRLDTTRMDGKIDFDWNIEAGSTRPLEGLSIIIAPFSIRWEGWILPPKSGEYTFIVDVKKEDETIILKIDDQPLDRILAEEPLSWRYKISLDEAKVNKLTLEYINLSESGGVHLSWKTDTNSKELIASGNFFPNNIVEEFKIKCENYHRAALFISGFELSATEVQHFVNYRINFSDINFTALTLEHWTRISQYVLLKDDLPKVTTMLIQVFEETNKTVPGSTLLIDLLSKATGWNPDYIRELQITFNSITQNFKNEIDLLRLKNAMQLTDQTSLSPHKVDSWIHSDSNPQKFNNDFDALYIIAQDIKSNVNAKYGEAEWLSVSKNISNKIRENQKQALINYLTVQPQLIEWGVADADSLFEYFLIDVQMDACMDTTRIVQAISSVQLFVARCLLNLESNLLPVDPPSGTTQQEFGVSPGYLDPKRWAWMKNYRVWEANHKIFLYPENWLEPEWRDDKSSFFKELESELLQNDITKDNVETAFRNYLNKLAEVSNLEVCGMYQDTNTKILHVFARTHAMPYQYFYRKRDEYQDWTAWEKVPLDIRSVEDGENSGVHLIPVVWKNRLILFWPEFMEKQKSKEENKSVPIEDLAGRPSEQLEPEKYWEVKLAWSEYKDGKWTPKQVSKEFISPLFDSTNAKEKNIRVNGLIDQESNKLSLIFSNNWKVNLSHFELTDINNKIKTDEPDDSSPQAITEFDSIRNPYQIKFMSFCKNDRLHLKDQDYLLNEKDHSLLYSNQISDFEATLNYPFFYQESDRSYFVEPFDRANFPVSIQTLQNGSLAGIAVIDIMKNPYEESLNFRYNNLALNLPFGGI